MTRRRAPRCAVLLAVLVLPLVACSDDGPGDVFRAPLTVSATETTGAGASPSATTSATETATPSSSGASGPAAAPTSASQAPDRPLTRTDTGYTRVRMQVASQAAWTDLELVGTEVMVAKPASTTGSARFTSLGPRISIAGQGVAVIDLVLSVLPGDDLALEMCKNYLGPAEVTVTRTTGAPAVIASLANTGTDPVVPPGGCENLQRVDLERSALIGPVRWPPRADARPLVLAHYYPWYDRQALLRSYGDEPRGPANTDDPSAVAEAVALAKRSGIDGFVVEFEGSPTNDRRIELVRSAAAARGLVTSLLVDADLMYRRDGQLTAQELDAALATVERLAPQAGQLRVGSDPVVFVYGAGRVDPAQWQAALQRLQARSGLTPFVVADDSRLGAAGRHLYSTNEQTDTDGLRRWSQDAVLEMRLQPSLAGDPPLWVAPVSPGYDDRRLGRLRSLFVDRRRGARYDESWDAALATLPDWVVVTSWNEYYEQTHVMPGSTTGSRALDQTADRAAGFHRTG